MQISVAWNMATVANTQLSSTQYLIAELKAWHKSQSWQWSSPDSIFPSWESLGTKIDCGAQISKQP